MPAAVIDRKYVSPFSRNRFAKFWACLVSRTRVIPARIHLHPPPWAAGRSAPCGGPGTRRSSRDAGNHTRGLDDFHLPEHSRFPPRMNERAAAVRPPVERVPLEVIDNLGQEGNCIARSCPGCLPFLRFTPPLPSGLMGLTIGLDGGLEEVGESWQAAANCRLRLRAFSFSSGAMRCIAAKNFACNASTPVPSGPIHSRNSFLPPLCTVHTHRNKIDPAVPIFGRA